MIIKLCIVFAFCGYYVNCDVQIGRDCSDCYPINSCPAALDIIKASNHNAEVISLLRNSHCGFTDRIPMVCCSYFVSQSPKSMSLAPPTTTLRPTAVPVSDAPRHPNQRLLPENCGDVNGERIVGGNIAMLNEFPWMALISYKNEDEDKQEFKCSGSLINERYVLTAAHCIIKDMNGVRLGEHDLSTKIDCQGEDNYQICQSYIQDIMIEKIIKHEGYRRRPNIQNDIALLRLAEPADFSQKNVGPICLPLTSVLQNRTVEDDFGTVAGWGRTENGETSKVLLKVRVPIAKTMDCVQTHFGDAEKVKDKLCAGELNKDSCDGDSGGPLAVQSTKNSTKATKDSSQGDSGGPLMIEEIYNNVYRYIIYGIVSYGRRDCGVYKYPGVYTDVRKYVTWILDNMEP